MNISGQDDNFFYTATGGRIAKGGLSPAKSQSYQDLLAQSFAPQPQMTPSPALMPNSIPAPAPAPAPMPGPATLAESGIIPANIAPMQATIPQPQSTNPWDVTAGQITSLDQLQTGPAAQQAQLGGMMGAPTAPAADTEAIAKMYTSGIGDMSKGIMQQQLGIEKMTNAQIAEANEIAKERARLNQQLLDRERELAEMQYRRQNAMLEAESKMQQTRQELADNKIDPDRYFLGQPGKRLLAGIAIAFGEVGRALTGSQTNAALNIINNAIEQDIAAQRYAREGIKERLESQRQGVADLRTRFGDEEQAIVARRIINTEMAQNKIQELADRYGTEEAQGKAQVLIGQLEQQKGQYVNQQAALAASAADKQYQRLVEAQEKKEKATTAKKPTQTQYMAAGFANRIQQAENVFSSLQGQGFNRASFGTALRGALSPEFMDTQQYKQQDQAERNFINAVLRRESGAAISKDEFANAETQYFPRAGDGPEVQAQKAANRKIVLDALAAEAGDLYKPPADLSSLTTLRKPGQQPKQVPSTARNR